MRKRDKHEHHCAEQSKRWHTMVVIQNPWELESRLLHCLVLNARRKLSQTLTISAHLSQREHLEATKCNGR
jgi:hypothetical protein